MKRWSNTQVDTTPQPFIARIIQFSAGATVGSVLVSSPETTSTASDTYTEVSASFSEFPVLTGGTTYLIFYSTIGATGAQSGNGLQWEITDVSNSQADASLVYLNSDTTYTGNYNAYGAPLAMKVVGETA